MPHTPASQHDTHDLELVAAFAAGDASGPDLETASALVASCADCAALHHDLRAIAAALPTIPAPVRPRDFRLSPDQAASLRPRGLRGLLAAFASPRLSFATPLGTGLAALGIVGVLVASGGLPVGGGATSGAAPENRDAATMEAPAEMAPDGASMAPFSVPETEFTDPAAGSSDPDGGLKTGTDDGAAAGGVEALVSTATNEGRDPLFVLGVLLTTFGCVLVVLRLAARRLARAP